MRLLVVLNWFCCNEVENDDIRVSSALVGYLPRNSSPIYVCLRNVHHLYQLPDFLVAVAFVMPLDASRLPLAMISERKRSWEAV